MTTIPGVSNNELVRTTWGNAVATELNTNSVRKNGRNAANTAAEQMTGPLILPTTQSTDAHAAVHKTYVDSTFANIAGDTMTGTLRIGGSSPADAGGVDLAATGAINATIASGTISTTNVVLNRFGTGPGPADVGGIFVSFRRGQTNQTGSITIGPSSSSTAFNTSSDERLKDVLGPVDEPLERVLALQPRLIAWKSDGVEQDSFLAHEVQPIAPYAVQGERGAVYQDGSINPQQLDAAKLIPLLVGAIQVLTARVAALEAV